MTARPELTRLRTAARRVARAEESAERARADRDEFVRDALHAGASVVEVAEVTGLSAPRVYQIRSGVR